MFEKVWGTVEMGIDYKFKCMFASLIVQDGCITLIKHLLWWV